MKAVISTAALALAAAANADLVRRNTTTVTGLLASVFDSMTNADNHILTYEGGPPIALHIAGEQVIGVLKEGITIAQSLEPLTLAEVEGISCLSDKVTEVGTKYLKDISAAVPEWSANGLCDLAHKFTEELGNVSSEFFSVMLCKYPPEAQEAANKEITGTKALFDEVLCSLSPPSCVNQIELPPIFQSGQCGLPFAAPSSEAAAAPTSESTGISVVWPTLKGLPCLPTLPCGLLNGANGANGASGAKGDNGASGAAGANGSTGASDSKAPSGTTGAGGSTGSGDHGNFGSHGAGSAIPVHLGSGGSLTASSSVMALICALAFML
ncbi:hypothetical protein F5Y14DRAFT_210126 [Nemania sp. NC0429]|nr:hypothetical protein F5Y14DRAFT_210126 [Nemania sp. NC0429]